MHAQIANPVSMPPNASWINSRGTWLTYIMLLATGHFVILGIPLLSSATVWTLTSCIHDIMAFYLLHAMKGVPWETADQGKSRTLTHWEQIEWGNEFSSTRKFLLAVPIVLFIVASFYTLYDPYHFIFNFCALMMVTLPKLPDFHKWRLWRQGINGDKK